MSQVRCAEVSPLPTVFRGQLVYVRLSQVYVRAAYFSQGQFRLLSRFSLERGRTSLAWGPKLRLF